MGVGIKENPNIKWIEGMDEKLFENIKGMNLNNGIGDLNLMSLSEMGYGFHLMQEVGF